MAVSYDTILLLICWSVCLKDSQKRLKYVELMGENAIMKTFKDTA